MDRDGSLSIFSIIAIIASIVFLILLVLALLNVLKIARLNKAQLKISVLMAKKAGVSAETLWQVVDEAEVYAPAEKEKVVESYGLNT